MSSPVTIGELFDLVIATEREAGRFYDALGERFSQAPPARDLWRALAADEREHAGSLLRIREAMAPSRLAKPADQAVALKARQGVRFSAETTLAEIGNLNDAYEVAHDLEFSEVNVVFEFLRTHFADTPEQRAFVRSEIRDHQARLLDFSRRFGSDHRREVPALEEQQTGSAG